MYGLRIHNISFSEDSKVRHLILRIKVVVLSKNMPYCELVNLVSSLTM